MNRTKLLFTAASIIAIISVTAFMSYPIWKSYVGEKEPPCNNIIPIDGEFIIDESYNGGTVCLPRNSAFVLNLDENQRIGSKWVLTHSRGLTVTHDLFMWTDSEGTPSDFIGIRGIHRWYFLVNETGQEEINGIFHGMTYNVKFFVR